MLDLGRVLGGSSQLISGDRITPIDKTHEQIMNRPFGRGPTTPILRGLTITIVINHLITKLDDHIFNCSPQSLEKIWNTM